MKNWFIVSFIFLILGLIIYANSLNNKFLMDDYAILSHPDMVQSKYILSQWDPYRDQASGVTDDQEISGYYRPLTHMVYDLCYSTFKSNYWQYHLFNLFLFVLSSSLIFLLIEQLTGNHPLAFLTGFLYLIHPINGIVVNYISASVFAFQVICMLGMILFLLGSLERNNDKGFYFLSLLFLFLSLFWNESGIMAPFYLCAVVLLFRQDPLRKKVFYLLPYFLIVLFYIVFRAVFGYGNSILGQMLTAHLTAGEYWASMFRVFAWYISKLFYPVGIVMQWATPVVHDRILVNVLGLGLLFMVFLSLFIRSSKEKICQLAISLFLIGFVPVCLAAFRAPANGVMIEPHWFIFSSVGFFILAAYSFMVFLDRMKMIGAVLLIIVIVSWGSVSHANNMLWADQKTYALYWSAQVPNIKLPYFYLADSYQRQGAFEVSKKYYRMALSGSPGSGWNVPIYDQLGTLDSIGGHFKEAELNLQKALKIDPNSGDTYDDLGAVYYAEGRLDKARVSFERSLISNPFLTEPRIGLALIYFNDLQYQKAIQLCLQNLDIIKDDPQTLQVLINVYARRKDLVNLKIYTERLINTSADPKVLTKLGIQMAENNVPDIAWECFMKAVHVAADYKDAYLAAGILLVNSGQYDKAIQILKIGESKDMSDLRFRDIIAKVEVLERKSLWH